MTEARKPGERPAHVKAPAHLSKSPPLPPPDVKTTASVAGEDPLGLNPVRYGDWTLKGIAVDF
jgi:Protein of unknown function (DUF1674)